ncbi:MAG: hypothetical protein ACUVQT_05235 [bacterium]
MIELENNSLGFSIIVMFIDTALNTVVIYPTLFNNYIFSLMGNKKAITAIVKNTIPYSDIISLNNIDCGSIAGIIC